MTSFMRSVTAVFAAGMIGGAGVLMALPDAAPSLVAVPDPPAASCKRQTWPNTDRGCLAWTAARRATRHVADHVTDRTSVASERLERRPVADASSAAAPSATAPSATAPSAAAPSAAASAPIVSDHVASDPIAAPVEHAEVAAVEPPVAADHGAAVGEEAAPAPRAVPQTRSDAPRTVRGRDVLARIPVTATASDGTRRTIVIRPRSMQDVYYYARRDLAAMEYGSARR